MTDQKGEREEALEAAQRVVDAFAWAANYKPHRNRPERDAFHAARALLSSSKAEGCPTAGYDQLGKSHYCVDCNKHWYGDEVPCSDTTCPFSPKESGK